MLRIKTRADFRDQDLKALENFATNDYLGARKLLLAQMPTQGAIQSITAIEKLTKAINLLLDNPINVGSGGGHNLRTLARDLQSSGQINLDASDLDFIDYADKLYALRYPDNLTSAFELYIPASKYLEALDLLYCKLINSDPWRTFMPAMNLFDVHVIKNAKNLFYNNSYYNRNIGQLSSSPQYCDFYRSDGSHLTYIRLTSRDITYESNWVIPQSIKDEIDRQIPDIARRIGP